LEDSPRTTNVRRIRTIREPLWLSSAFGNRYAREGPIKVTNTRARVYVVELARIKVAAGACPADDLIMLYDVQVV